MKKLTTLLLSALCAAGLSAQAQDNCYFPTTKGAELSYKYYNARGRELKNQWKDARWLKLVVEEVWPSEDGMVINVGVGNDLIERMAVTHMLGLAAGNLSYGDVKIEGDCVTLDNVQWLADALPEMFMYMIAHDRKDGMQYDVELMAQTSFPRTMTVGDELPDETILDAKYVEVLTTEQQAEREERFKEMQTEVSMMSQAHGYTIVGAPMNFSDFGIKAQGQIRKRKVEAYEKVETPAGTFDCYKITYELVVPNTFNFGGMGPMPGNMDFARGSGRFPQQPQEPEGTKYADWISPEVGLVKRENYNNRGKLQEVMRLESYTK